MSGHYDSLACFSLCPFAVGHAASSADLAGRFRRKFGAICFFRYD